MTIHFIMRKIKTTPKEDLHFGKRFARSMYNDLTGLQNARNSNKLGFRQSRRGAFFKIKNSLYFSDLCQAADFIDRNINEKYKDLMFGNPLPKNYETLGVCDFIATTENFINEFNWTLISIRKFAYHINLFLLYKEQYEKYLLVGEYSQAEIVLNKIENEICYSLYTLENRFLLKEFMNKGNENKDFLEYFNEVNQSDGYAKSLANYLSNRAEKTLSVNRFNSELHLALNRMDSYKKSEHSDYYFFKLSFLNPIDFTYFNEIISYDFQFSIIDRYLNLRKVLALLITTSNNKINDIEAGITIKHFVLNRVNYMLRKIKDESLNKLKLFSSETLFPAFEYEKSLIQIQIIDKYTTGLYQEVETDLADYLLIEPNQFDLYVLYIKSLIYQKKKFQFVGNNKSVQNEILLDLFKIISATGNPDDAGFNLLRIANNLTSSVISYGISDFVINRTRGKNERQLLSRLSYNAANPIIVDAMSSIEAKITYLKFLQSKFPNSVSVDFLLCKLDNPSGLIKFEKIIPLEKYKTELAKVLQSDAKFEEASKIWEQIILNNSDTIPILETAIKNLFICYEELRRFDDCVRLYVDSFFRNTFLINKIKVGSLITKIKENRFRVVKASLELPIFYTICKADENELHTAFEKFNIDNNINKPSELLSFFDSFNYTKILYYLKHTCSLDILRHSTHINGSKERLEERLSIIQFLKSKDSLDKEIYNDEIKYISNILIIQKGLIDLDDGKIYVNEQGIFQNELKEYEAIYKRFNVIAGLAAKKKSLLFLNKGKLTQLNYTDENAETEKIEYSNNPVFDIYLELFDAIKYKFLYSKDGIVAYLSTRIRHGVLLGEIRPIFEKFKLITQKEGDSSIYRRNYYWDSKYNFESTYVKDLIQNLLKDFSYKVDGVIFDLIKKFLQVYDNETNPQGWFNYNFDDGVLFWFSLRSLNSSDYGHFVQMIFEILWDRTDENLAVIRNKIQTEVLTHFNKLFDDLERDFIHQLGDSKSQAIVNSIKACSTEMQTVIKRISSWFKRSGTSASDFQLENVIDIVLGYADKGKRIHLDRELNYNYNIKGVYLKHFADLFWIFIDNIIKHSDNKVDIIDAKISTSLDENNILQIQIENEITKKQSLDALKNVSANNIFDIKKLLSEGKSGYHKAFKILQYDLLNKKNNIWTQVSANEELFIVNLSVNLNDLI